MRFGFGFGFGRRRPRSFTPAALFVGGVSGAWYDPSDLAMLFQDAAGTVPVAADGDPVGKMLDKSGNGNHLAQAAAGSRPLYKTAGGLAWLQFDGVDDGMTGTLPVATMGANLSKTMSCAVALTNLADQDVMFHYGGATANDAFGLVPNTVPGNDITLFQYGAGVNGGAAQLAAAVITGIKSGNDLSIRKNGAVVAGPTTLAPANIVDNTLRLSSNGIGSFGGKLYGLIVVAGNPAPELTEAFLSSQAGL